MTCGIYSVYIGISTKNISLRWTSDHDSKAKKWPKKALRTSDISGFHLRVAGKKGPHRASIYYWLHSNLKGKAAVISKNKKAKRNLIESLEHIMVFQTSKTRQKGEVVDGLHEYCKCNKKPGKKKVLSHGKGKKKSIPPSLTLLNKEKNEIATEGKWNTWLEWTSKKFGQGQLIITGGPRDSRKINKVSIKNLCSQSLGKNK
tara:strand:- start:97 stop:702 length:606 start_codon:yes stop_codon:yes gene_type:complete